MLASYHNVVRSRLTMIQLEKTTLENDIALLNSIIMQQQQ